MKSDKGLDRTTGCVKPFDNKVHAQMRIIADLTL
jgi:hypothetical protein